MRLEDELAELREGDLVLYQAGADPHVRDPLGGWMGDAELRHRDEVVFEAVKAAGVPLVWNLAGGYQRDAAGGIEPVIAIHTRTALEHLRVFDGWVAPGGNGDFPGHSR
jgi:acetoin utilization deacetylase AcuC-like enzyme